ncbi:protein SEC13 homolog [Daphnia pulicaria]|uniref:protein SEC13 homolog n=1 Tax=Daphnia pulicaria TaxID=35523 RepID=UPI001EEC5C64|nr:protein SEC13 homolog [Daphnia pulicaria]
MFGNALGTRRLKIDRFVCVSLSVFFFTQEYFITRCLIYKFSVKMVSVISTVDTGHGDMIHDAQMDYYGCRLATCSSDRSVRIYDVKNGTQTLAVNLRGHEGLVWQIAWAHPKFGNILASCSYDHKVIIWKEMNGQWVKFYEYANRVIPSQLEFFRRPNHDSSLNSVCWAPHDYGLILACGSSDGSISILSATAAGGWEAKKINNAHTVCIPPTIGVSRAIPAPPVTTIASSTTGCWYSYDQ